MRFPYIAPSYPAAPAPPAPRSMQFMAETEMYMYSWGGFLYTYTEMFAPPRIEFSKWSIAPVHFAIMYGIRWYHTMTVYRRDLR